MSKYFYLIGIVIMIMSCGKDIDLFVPRENQDVVGDIERLKAKLFEAIKGDITYTLTCPCSGDRVIEVDKDLVLSIPPDFVDLTQYPCTNGYFDIVVNVCDSKGEMLIAGIPTISEGKLLESRMEFHLQVKDGNSHVNLANGKKIRALINDPDPRDRMELFYGNDDNTEWLQADENPDTWNNVANAEWFFQQDSQIITGFGYECFSDSLDWINVDVFFEIPEDQRTDVCVDLPKEFTNTNTQVFMVFNDYNSIVTMPGDSAQQLFCEHYGATPIGFNVTFIVISEMGEDCYLFATTSTVITPHHLESMIPVKTPFDEIKNYIMSL